MKLVTLFYQLSDRRLRFCEHLALVHSPSVNLHRVLLVSPRFVLHARLTHSLPCRLRPLIDHVSVLDRGLWLSIYSSEFGHSALPVCGCAVRDLKAGKGFIVVDCMPKNRVSYEVEIRMGCYSWLPLKLFCT